MSTIYDGPCPTCDQRRYHEVCDACGKTIDISLRDRIRYTTNRDGKFYELMMDICQECRSATISVENIAQHLIAQMEAST